MATSGPQNGRRGLERGVPLGSWALPSTFANKFFDQSIPSMRKVDNRKKQRKKIMMKIVATNVIACRPPECRLYGTPNAHNNSIIEN